MIMGAIDIKVRDKNDQVVKGKGWEVGIYTIGPTLRTTMEPDSRFWAIRHRDSGINIATFEDRHVALNFLRWLIKTYGDINVILQHCADHQETPEDSAILDAIQARSKHYTRVHPDPYMTPYRDDPVTPGETSRILNDLLGE